LLARCSRIHQKTKHERTLSVRFVFRNYLISSENSNRLEPPVRRFQWRHHFGAAVRLRTSDQRQPNKPLVLARFWIESLPWQCGETDGNCESAALGSEPEDRAAAAGLGSWRVRLLNDQAIRLGERHREGAVLEWKRGCRKRPVRESFEPCSKIVGALVILRQIMTQSGRFGRANEILATAEAPDQWR
jgi:hypothetical protein